MLKVWDKVDYTGFAKGIWECGNKCSLESIDFRKLPMFACPCEDKEEEEKSQKPDIF